MSPDPAYVATYTNPHVGDIDVVVRNGKVEIVEGPNDIRFTLKRLDGDTFSYNTTPSCPTTRRSL
jgi:hypothetical protein